MSKIARYLTVLAIIAAPALASAQDIPQGAASLNWAGYVAQSGTYTSVTGTWVVPAVSTATTGTADAAWVGIGGVSSHDLIQAGTQALVSNSGAVSYQAWIETLPSFSKTVPLTIESGDSITSTITEQQSNVWQITITDNTSGQHYQTSLDYDSSLSSAEWIEEMVSNSNGTFRPLDNFGSVSFTGGSTVVNGQSENISQAGAQPLSMINGAGQPLATAGSVGSDGGSFSIARTSNNPDTSVGTPTLRRGYGGRWRVWQTATSSGAEGTSFTITARASRADEFLLLRTRAR